jgi:hypothetical protein
MFFQDALRDEAVAREDALAYRAAGSEPKQIEWYESSHSSTWRIGSPVRLVLMLVDSLGDELTAKRLRSRPTKDNK